MRGEYTSILDTYRHYVQLCLRLITVHARCGPTADIYTATIHARDTQQDTVQFDLKAHKGLEHGAEHGKAMGQQEDMSSTVFKRRGSQERV